MPDRRINTVVILFVFISSAQKLLKYWMLAFNDISNWARYEIILFLENNLK
jgi:hypothetical protein